MFNIVTMQGPNPSAEDHSIANPAEGFTATDAAGGAEVDFTGEVWSSAVVKKGRIGRGRPRSVGDKEDPLKGSSSVGARRKRVWKHAKCPCPVCEPSKKHADSNHQDDVKAGVEIDLEEPMEGVDAAEKKKSEEEKRSGAAANGSAMDNSEAEAKTESSEKENRVVEGKDDRKKEEGEGSSAANKGGEKKAFEFDLNEFPSEE